jgi:hypothetical protein
LLRSHVANNWQILHQGSAGHDRSALLRSLQPRMA